MSSDQQQPAEDPKPVKAKAQSTWPAVAHTLVTGLCTIGVILAIAYAWRIANGG